MPQLETNSAQEHAEVLDLLLRQLGYPTSKNEEVQAAWLAGIAEWRGKRAADERNLGALRSFAELGNMRSVQEIIVYVTIGHHPTFFNIPTSSKRP